eukprot:TRINITY_DN1495_c5_g1_i1.p1 TRINITY_DN1495_c5_g1~~TRINITY_DN1495_c5_g1_i1.p1  ORF type:complete len:307 (+),score=55.10 TRINITY_DN1495_c5_g1_i1:44-964(+)
MTAATATEESPRLRRKSTFRVWTREQEATLMEIENSLEPEGIAGSRGSQILRRWEEAGYHQFTEEELLKKVDRIRKITQMLSTKPEEGDLSKKYSSTSLQEDAKWEEETLYMAKMGQTDQFHRRLTLDKRASQVSDAKGRLALHHAVASGNLDIVKMIAQTDDADIEATDISGRMPLFYALENANHEIISWYLDQEIDTSVSDNKGITLLHVAAYTNNLKAVKRIIEIGKADINAADEKGTTPLHVAAHRASVDVISVLLENGADPLIRDKRGNLPEQLALRMEKRGNHKRLSLASVASFSKKPEA